MLDEMDGYFALAEEYVLDPWVRPLIWLLDSMVPWDLRLPADWRNLFVLLTLYLSSHVKEALADNVPHKPRAVMLRGAAALIGLVLATTVATLLSSAGWTRLQTAVLASLTGIITYRLGFAAQFAYDRWVAPTNPHSFRAEFTRKAVGSLYLVLGSVITLIFANVVSGKDINRWDFFWVLLLASLLGIFHVELARRSPATTGNRNIGRRILEGVAFAVLALLLATPLRDLFPG